MIKVKKSKALPELTTLQKEAVENGLDADAAFESLRNPLKAQVLQQLSRDQGALCAYCMRRIPDERGLPHAKIEHWVPRNSANSTCGAYGALDYNNMLAVCSGNQPDKSRRHELTCDASRGNKSLTVNPLDDSTISTIFYNPVDGTIHASDPVINTDLVSTLNLNCNVDAVQLPNSRKAVLDTVDLQIAPLIDDVNELLLICKKLLSVYEADSENKQPYVGIIIWRLKCIISKLEKTE